MTITRTIHEEQNRRNRRNGRNIVVNHGQRVVREIRSFEFGGETVTVGKVTLRGREVLVAVSPSKYGITSVLRGSGLAILGDLYNRG